MLIRRIGGGLLALAGVVGGPMLDRILPPDPSAPELIIGWGAVAILILAGLTMAFWPEKRSGVNTGIKIKAKRNAVVTRVKLDGYDNAVDMDVEENGHISDVEAKAPEKKT